MIDALEVLDRMYLQRMGWTTYISPRFFRKVTVGCGAHCLRGVTLDYFHGIGVNSDRRWNKAHNAFDKVAVIERTFKKLKVLTVVPERNSPCKFFDPEYGCKLVPLEPLFCSLQPVRLRKVPRSRAVSLTTTLPFGSDSGKWEESEALVSRIKVIEELGELATAVGVPMEGFEAILKFFEGRIGLVKKELLIAPQLKGSLYGVYSPG